jgi:hypothetical protein
MTQGNHITVSKDGLHTLLFVCHGFKLLAINCKGGQGRDAKLLHNLEEYGTYETDVRQIFLYFFLIFIYIKNDLQQFQI